jgi:flavodoxin I
MKTTIIYSTLSGSTMTAADVVAAVLRAAGHEVDVLMADGVNKDTVKASGAIIFGSPSWEDEGKDGQPLPDVTRFIKSLTAEDVAGKKLGIFGLGDTSYPHYCGAVDVMEGLFKGINLTPAVESLRIDRYYSLPDNETKTKTWAEGLAKALS